MNPTDQAHQELEPTDDVAVARSLMRQRAHELGQGDLADDAALVVSELVTNALLPAAGARAWRSP